MASLATTTVTLAPGTDQVVPITTGTVSFADPGNLALTAIATSQTNSAVVASDTADLTISQTQGMTAQFQQPTQVIPLPGTSDFLLLVNNTGNMQDSYSATITGTTGTVTASLTGLDGNPTQSIPEFILPGLSTGAILLQTDLTATGQGKVTIQVQSLSNPSETTTATATVSATTASTPIQPVIQLTASPGSTTTYGQSVSFTATVGPPASGDPTPTGTVQFQIDGSNFGSPVTLDNNGSATSDAISTLTAVGHTITALYSGDPTYAQGSQTLTQTVNPATPTVNWNNPTDIVYGAALSATQLDATASVPGGFAYNPGFGAVLNAGDNQTLSTTFTPTDTTDYTDATANVAINALQATPTVNVTAPNAAYNGSPYSVLTSSVTGINNANLGAASSFTYYVGVDTGGTDLGSTAPTAAGTYTVVAHYAGSANYAAADSVQATFTIATVIALPSDGPEITLVQRYGIHWMPTTLVLYFNQALDPALAQDVQEYQLVDPHGHDVAITAADYDPTTDTVTLHLSQRINFHRRYKLTVDGASPSGLTDSQGVLLDGKATGHPGSNYVTTVDRRDLVWPDRKKQAIHKEISIKDPRSTKLSTGHDVHGTQLFKRSWPFPASGSVSMSHGKMSTVHPLSARPRHLMARLQPQERKSLR